MQNNDIYKNVLNNAIASVEMEGYKLEENQKEHFGKLVIISNCLREPVFWGGV